MHNIIVWIVWTFVFSILAELYHFRVIRRFKYNSNRVKEERKIRVVLHSLSLAIAANIATHSLPGWIMFLLSAVLLFHFFYYRDEKLRLFEQFTWYSDVEDVKEIRRFKQKNRDVKITQLVGLAVIASASIFWGYQDFSKNIHYIDQFKNNHIELEGNGWCNNVEYYGGEPVWGWPCVLIEEVVAVDFVEKSGPDLACVKLTFTREIGPPGEDNYEKNYKEGQFCVSLVNDWAYGTSNVTDKAYKFIADDLDRLNKELCSRFQDALSREDYLNSCKYID